MTVAFQKESGDDKSEKSIETEPALHFIQKSL